jgi:hypothetical protein
MAKLQSTAGSSTVWPTEPGDSLARGKDRTGRHAVEIAQGALIGLGQELAFFAVRTHAGSLSAAVQGASTLASLLLTLQIHPAGETVVQWGGSPLVEAEQYAFGQYSRHARGVVQIWVH